MIFFDAKCNRCGAFVQLVYNRETDSLRGCRCEQCGEELPEQRVKRIEYHLDGLISAIENQCFSINTATIRLR